MEGYERIINIHKVWGGRLAVGVKDNRRWGRETDALVYFTEGEVTYTFDPDLGGILKARRGTVILLPKGSRYFMDIHSPSGFICADIDLDEGSYIRKAELFPTDASCVSSDFSRLLSLLGKTSPEARADAFAAIWTILSACLKSKRKKYTRSDIILSGALEYINESFSEPTLTVLDIASAVGVSEPHLGRVFREKLGVSPMRRVNLLRIERAKDLISSSNLQISEIAQLSGFADPYYFSREFKKTAGMTPTEYRKNISC